MARFVDLPPWPNIVPAFIVLSVSGPDSDDPAYQGEVLRPGALAEITPLIRQEASRLLWTPMRFRLFVFDYHLPLHNAERSSRGIDRLYWDCHRAYGVYGSSGEDLILKAGAEHFDPLYDGIVGRTNAILPAALIELPSNEEDENYESGQGRVVGDNFYSTVNPTIEQLLIRGFFNGPVAPRVIGICNQDGLKDFLETEKKTNKEDESGDDIPF